MKYKLKLDIFEGPLDLLLYLIKKNELDITDIPILEITEQYMQYIEMMKLLDLDIVGDFLVMAATLMHIKSSMLLPPDPLAQEDEEIDPRDELVRRLQEYKQFKEIAERLKEQSEYRADLFARDFDGVSLNELKEESREVLFDVNLFDLIGALTEALKRVPAKKDYEISAEVYTVEEKVFGIRSLLAERSRISVNVLFAAARDRMEIIVTFMAVLELCRIREVLIIQESIFSDIMLEQNTVGDEGADQPLNDESLLVADQSLDSST